MKPNTLITNTSSADSLLPDTAKMYTSIRGRIALPVKNLNGLIIMKSKNSLILCIFIPPFPSQNKVNYI